MTSSRPPNMATRLLEHLRSKQSTEFLVGDLVEEYGRGRSNVWYWRQVLTAIIISLYRDVRANWFLAIRATVTGWAASYLFQLVVFGLVSRFHLWPTLHNDIAPFHGYGFSASLTWLILWTPIWVGSGWYVGRLYRSQLPAMVLLFSLSVLAWNLLKLPVVIHLLLNTASDPGYFPQLAAGLMNWILPPVYIVLGGLIASRCRRDYLASTVSAGGL